MLRKIRIALAAVFFIGITLLFLDFTGTIHLWLGWMADIQALEAVLALHVVSVVVLAVLTLVFGRIYCSVICPLGIMQDLFGWMGKKAHKNRYTYSPAKTRLRHILLALFLVAFLAGIGSIVQLLAPYSAFARIVTMIFQPLYLLGNNFLAYLAERADSYAFYSTDVWLTSLPVLIIAVVTFVALIVLAWRGGRTYCNTICPVGTVLSWLARYSWLKIRFDADKCKNCSLCTKNCKASCIDYKTHTVDYSRCVVCGDCIEKCKFGALKYAGPSGQDSSASPTSAGRRSFLVGSALVVTAALAEEKHVKAGLAAIGAKQSPERQTPLTPPGSLSAEHIAKCCTGCQLCVSVCPNNVLRPSSNLMSLMQPVMSFERGYCRPECIRCTELCPSNAIEPISLEEKAGIQMGHAVVTATMCLSAQEKDECGNCERHCPSGAITMEPSDPEDDFSPYVPKVDATKCTGCGACEYVCPVRPLPAIHVEGYAEHRYTKPAPQEAADQKEVDEIPCVDCKKCLSACPYGIDIPALFLHHNKMKGQPAREYLISLDREVPRMQQADHCIKCGHCMADAKCPKDIRIPAKLGELSDYVEQLRRSR